MSIEDGSTSVLVSTGSQTGDLWGRVTPRHVAYAWVPKKKMFRMYYRGEGMVLALHHPWALGPK